jgi:hypothetical protein
VEAPQTDASCCRRSTRRSETSPTCSCCSAVTAGSSTSAAILAPHKPAGLVSYFDAGLVLLAETAEHLGLPFHSPATATSLVDKLRQRQALAVAGVETPRWLALPAEPTAVALARLADDFPWRADRKPVPNPAAGTPFSSPRLLNWPIGSRAWGNPWRTCSSRSIWSGQTFPPPPRLRTTCPFKRR